MIKTKQVMNFTETLEEAIESVIQENKITRDKLIDIKYAVRTPAFISPTVPKGGKPYFVDQWYASALIIWEE